MTMTVDKKTLRGSSALRGLRALRVEADPMADIRALIAQIGEKQKEQAKTFDAFKAENDAAIKDAVKDVVQTEKVDRINAALEEQGKSIDELNAAIAAMK